MKAKLLTLALFGFMALSFMACNEEEIVPVNDVTLEQSGVGDTEGGLSDREEPPGLGDKN